MTVGHPSPLHVTKGTLGPVVVLNVDGVLDSTTYSTLRDSIIKAALDTPTAVVVDVTALVIPAPSACAVFSSARWQVTRWPDVPVLLACAEDDRRDVLIGSGIGRYVPIHPDVDAAADAVGVHARARVRRRARVDLLRDPHSVAEAKEFVTECLLEWARPQLVSRARAIVRELVRNALTHTDSAPSLRVECSGPWVTVAVDDGSPRLATLAEWTLTRRVTGLEIVAGLSRAWGNSPSSTGKTVWAMIEPEALDA